MRNEIKPAIVQFDIDGVVSRNDLMIVNGVNKIFAHEGFPMRFTPDDIDSYYWADKLLADSFGYTPEHVHAITDQWYSGESLYRNEPFKGAVLGLKLLHFLYKGQINFATSRNEESKEATYAWFEKYFPPAVHDGRIYMKDEFGLTGSDLKRTILHLSGAKRHYEDDGETARKVGKGAVLLDKPYNRQPEYQNLKRVYRNWLGILGNEIASLKK